MSFERSLLPPNYPKYGRAVDEAGAGLAELPVDIAKAWNPATCPEALLPFLAWGLSVDVWNSAWPVERRRAAVANSIDMHRHKGTLGGIRDHVAAVGSSVLSAVTPPAASYCSPDITDEERRAFLATLPQLRLFDRWDAGLSIATFWDDFSHADGGAWDTDSFAAELLFECEGSPRELPVLPGVVFGDMVDLTDRTGEHAVLWQAGVSTPLVPSSVNFTGDHYEVLLPGELLGGVAVGDYLDDNFFLANTAGDRFFSFALKAAGSIPLYSFAVHAGLDAVNTEPDWVHELGTDLAGVFCDQTFDGFYFMPNTAAERLYRVIYFFREGEASYDSRALSFLDDARFGIDAYTAELAVLSPGWRPPWAGEDFVDGFWYDDPPALLDDTLAAVVAAQAERDVILVNFAIFKPRMVGQRLLIGTPLILGEMSATPS